MCNHQINTCKDEWNTKQGTGKSMKSALYIVWYAKGHLRGVKQWKNQARSLSLIVKLCWSKGIRQADRQLVN